MISMKFSFLDATAILQDSNCGKSGFGSMKNHFHTQIEHLWHVLRKALQSGSTLPSSIEEAMPMTRQIQYYSVHFLFLARHRLTGSQVPVMVLETSSFLQRSASNQIPTDKTENPWAYFMLASQFVAAPVKKKVLLMNPSEPVVLLPAPLFVSREYNICFSYHLLFFFLGPQRPFFQNKVGPCSQAKQFMHIYIPSQPGEHFIASSFKRTS